MPDQLPRRAFLKLLALISTLAGCRGLARQDTAWPTDIPAPLQIPSTLVIDLRFVLENQAVDYSAHPAGCNQTTIQGHIRDEGGNGIAGIVLRVWAEDRAWAQVLLSDAEGAYTIDVAQGLTQAVYKVQLFDPGGTTILSDAIVVQAIPSCDLNLMTVNFVALR